MRTSLGIFVLVMVFSMTFACNTNIDRPAFTPPSLRIPNADNPAIGIGGRDSVFAVWSAATSSTLHANPYASRYLLSGWEKPVFIGDADVGMITFLRLAVSPDGGAFAFWYKETGNIYVSRYVPGSGWGPPEVLGGPLTILDLQATADATGGATVLWEEPDYRLYARRYVLDSGWGAAYTIDGNTGNCSLSRIVADNDGNVIAVWQQYDGTYTGIYANRFTAGSTWGTPILISNSTTTSAFAPDIAVNKNGTAMAVWYEDNDGTDNAYARRFVPGTGWDAIQSIESGTSNAYDVRVAIDDSGTAISLWRQPDLYYSRYVPGAGWSTPQTIASGFLSDPSVAMNGAGQAVAVWNQYPVADSLVYAGKFNPSTGWGRTTDLMSESGSADAPHAVINSRGQATVIWSQTVASGTGGSTTTVFTKNY